MYNLVLPWLILQILVSDARVLGVGPRFMSIYVQKFAVCIVFLASLETKIEVISPSHNFVFCCRLKSAYIMMTLMA